MGHRRDTAAISALLEELDNLVQSAPGGPMSLSRTGIAAMNACTRAVFGNATVDPAPVEAFAQRCTRAIEIAHALTAAITAPEGTE
ncbi:hypothetical protein [Nocardia sp. XZ_19_385]|nr:hypothetical protein [Nocardia sp. XZ_19_385]